MAKGKQSSSSRSRAVDTFDDGASVAGSSVSGTPQSQRNGARDEEDDDTIDDTYHDALEALFEKRGATRAKAYSTLITYLKSDLRGGESDKNCQTLVGRVIDSVRRGSTEERCVAATVLSLHFLSLPDVPETLFAEVRAPLEVACREGEPESRAVCIESLSWCCYVGGDGEDETRAVMRRLEAMVKGDGGSARASALRGWSLLFTSLNVVLSSGEVEGMLEAMALLMSADKSVDVRSAAGEVVALLCSSYKFLQAWADETDEFSGEDDDAESYTSSEVPESLDGLVHRMRDLATHNRHDATRTSKRAKAQLRTTFRSILSSVEDGLVKAEKIKLKHGDVVVVDTLSGKVAMAACKRLLAGGLQAHLVSNPLLHAIFEFSPTQEPPDRLSGLEKRHYKSPNSAAARDKTSHRKADRSFKSGRHAAGAADGGGGDW